MGWWWWVFMLAAPPEAECLRAAYPDHICGTTATEVVWCDGTRMPWRHRDEALTDFQDRLNKADLRDQLSQKYPRAWPDAAHPPPKNFDPGRLRDEAFFKKMYGANAAAVDKTLVPVKWLPKHTKKTLRVTTVNGVHEKLAAVSAALDELPPDVRRFVETPSGTFVWRTIKGTERLSMHSFAISIDVGVKFSDYWKWNKPDAAGHYPFKNRFPQAVVDIFEAHGFIWGGKWYHFDTMHFEYRPELLVPACTRPDMPTVDE